MAVTAKPCALRSSPQPHRDHPISGHAEVPGGRVALFEAGDVGGEDGRLVGAYVIGMADQLT